MHRIFFTTKFTKNMFFWTLGELGVLGGKNLILLPAAGIKLRMTYKEDGKPIHYRIFAHLAQRN